MVLVEQAPGLLKRLLSLNNFRRGLLETLGYKF